MVSSAIQIVPWHWLVVFEACCASFWIWAWSPVISLVHAEDKRISSSIIHLFIYRKVLDINIIIDWYLLLDSRPFPPSLTERTGEQKERSPDTKRTRIYYLVLIIYLGITCLKEGDSQNKNHPNVYPLDIGSGQNRLWNANEAGRTKYFFRCFRLLGIKHVIFTSEMFKKGQTESEWVSEATTFKPLNLEKVRDVQRSENQKHSEVNLNHQVWELLSKYLSNQAVTFIFTVRWSRNWSGLGYSCTVSGLVKCQRISLLLLGNCAIKSFYTTSPGASWYF